MAKSASYFPQFVLDLTVPAEDIFDLKFHTEMDVKGKRFLEKGLQVRFYLAMLTKG